MKNAHQNGIIKASKGGDYIFKKTEGDMFTTTQINEYLQLFGIECDNRSIVRDIEAINQAYIMSRDESDSREFERGF